MSGENAYTKSGRMRKVDLPMICGWIVQLCEEIPSAIIWEEEAANDSDSDVDSDGDLLYPDSAEELRAVFDEESIDEDFLGFG